MRSVARSDEREAQVVALLGLWVGSCLLQYSRLQHLATPPNSRVGWGRVGSGRAGSNTPNEGCRVAALTLMRVC